MTSEDPINPYKPISEPKIGASSLSLEKKDISRPVVSVIENRMQSVSVANEPKSESHRSGDVKTVPIAGIDTRFRWCPSGRFMMGSPEDEEGRVDIEIRHEVILTHGFWLAETPTTQRLWKAVVGKNPSYRQREYKFYGLTIWQRLWKVTKGGNQAVLDDSDLPVESVSWNDCQDFIAKIQQYAPSGMKFQLPSEAQWEYACRAGTTGSYNVAGASLDSLAWYAGNSGGKTYPVGNKTPNAWGLYDMHGNVWEWCSDWYGDYPSGTITDPRDADTGSFRVIRGGSWLSHSWICRSANRFGYRPGEQSSHLGFRLELDAFSGVDL